ncbi:MAG: S8/S53 family peptidase [Candidatus Heimdallarchaeaceae archaeon]
MYLYYFSISCISLEKCNLFYKDGITSSIDLQFVYTSYTLDDGYPEETVNWINVNEAFSSYPELRYNHAAYRIAVLDTGLDYATWNYFASRYSNDLVQIRLYDRSGNEVLMANTDDNSPNHHGSAIVHLILRLLERESHNVEVSLSVFMVNIPGTIFINASVVKEQLQRIKAWNDAHGVGKYKVVSMSFGADAIFSSELYALYQQKVILVAASGNFISKKVTTEPYLYENVKTYPAYYTYTFGVGGIYGYQGVRYEISRMTTKYNKPTKDYYVGSMFYESYYYKTVNLVAPAYLVEIQHDIDNDGCLEIKRATGTSLAVPQVAVAAYLSANIKYYLNMLDPLTYSDFMEAIMASCENYPSGRTSPYKLYCEDVGEPIINLGTYNSFYSYRVGWGSLDVRDLIQYTVETLS